LTPKSEGYVLSIGDEWQSVKTVSRVGQTLPRLTLPTLHAPSVGLGTVAAALGTAEGLAGLGEHHHVMILSPMRVGVKYFHSKSHNVRFPPPEPNRCSMPGRMGRGGIL
jgi:hypothetical protein